MPDLNLPVDSETYKSREGAPPSGTSACHLVGLPEDVERQTLACLRAHDCVALRASSKSVGCQLISEGYVTHRLDAALREKGLDGVLTYQKRCETVLLILLQWMAAIFSVVSAIAQVVVGSNVYFFVYGLLLYYTANLIGPPASFLLQPLAVFPWIQWPIQGLLSLLAWAVPFFVIEAAIRWLGEASFVVRAYRQFCLAFDDLGHGLGVWILLECAKGRLLERDLTPPLGVAIMVGCSASYRRFGCS
ncbi:unnamed protein product [Vitrella brassicaformis CCMP3155]|uniref:Uncharacterized protein n=1 Tax=Vitrella brassicaformis (strain CCMP3155) TaxID=1169540 RepID=A0A0G4EMD6_VITBC|nr:unnamed protein product [Vitrella brassicaformis CCMP3155]|eukprot:CEL98545.1 unnamed protein product [Vitrella brassicaformis CCMP3155]